MRPLSLALLAAALLSAWCRAADDEDPPIPQDAAVRKRNDADRVAWLRRTLRDGYEQASKKDPRWDGLARAAVEAAVRAYTRDDDAPFQWEALYIPAKRAVDAGCDDPLVLYLYARASVPPNHPGAAEATRRFVTAAEAAQQSRYGPFRRAVAMLKAGQALAAGPKPTAADRAAAERWLDAALGLLGESTRVDGRGWAAEGEWHSVIDQAASALNGMFGSLAKTSEHVDALLAKAPERQALRLQVRGEFLVLLAWEARGDGFAGSVTEEGGRLFDERLREARKALDASWALESGDPRTAVEMVKVLRGLGSDRAEMELWFARAMTADPDNRAACVQKMDWLDPKWHGTREELLAFGRACRDTRNWRAGITLLIADSYVRAADRLDRDERGFFMVRPGVAKNVQAAYEEYLGHFPDRHAERSVYAALLYQCGKYAEADKQFKLVGDNLTPSRRYPKAWMLEVRDIVAERARNRPATGAQAGPGFGITLAPPAALSPPSKPKD